MAGEIKLLSQIDTAISLPYNDKAKVSSFYTTIIIAHIKILREVQTKTR